MQVQSGQHGRLRLELSALRRQPARRAVHGHLGRRTGHLPHGVRDRLRALCCFQGTHSEIHNRRGRPSRFLRDGSDADFRLDDTKIAKVGTEGANPVNSPADSTGW